MILKGKQNHYNVKFLKGYGFSINLLRGYGVSINLKDNRIILKNGQHDITGKSETEEYFVHRMHYEKIDNSSCQRSGYGYWVNDFS